MALSTPDQRKRIALISEHASPLADIGSVDSGGQNVYVAQVARRLARQGFQVDVFTRRDSEALPDILVWEDHVRVIHVPAGPAEFVRKEELLQYMGEFRDFIVKFCRRQGYYDLVHANFWMSALVAINLKRALGMPFVVTFHALGRVRRQHQGKDDGFPDDRFAVEDLAVQEAGGIVAECPQDEADLICLYHADPHKIAIIPCGFDASEVWPLDKSVSRQVLGLPQKEKVVLQLGRMVPRKGVDNVIRGFARLSKSYGVRARLLIVGGESETPDPQLTPEIGRLQAIAAAEGIAGQVTFVGRRGRDAIKHYYSAADVFVSTPWYEPFGITPVEAMACGTPVIGSQVGGIKYSVSEGETGYLVPPNDPEALAERLAYLFQNPKALDRLSRQAVRRANQLFTWDRVVEQMVSFYEQVISQAETPASLPVEHGEAEPAAFTGPAGAGLDLFDQGFEDLLQGLRLAHNTLRGPVEAAARAMLDTLTRGGKVLVCGNGGSAADAQHFSAEFVGRFLKLGRRALPVMALTADSAFLTAWSNDTGFDQVFSRQVEAYASPGDLLFGITTSGQSRNLIEAFQTARALGIGCIALTGGIGGELLDLADLGILVPAHSTPRIQEVQILVLHLICDLVETGLEAVETSPASTFLQTVTTATGV